MVGTVTTRHLLTHSAVIVHEFGARCYFRCLWRTLTSRHAVTFLECVECLKPVRGERGLGAGQARRRSCDASASRA